MGRFVAPATLLAAALLAVVASAAPRRRPVVLMHGMAQTAAALGSLQGWIEADFPDIHVLNVALSTNASDPWAGIIDSVIVSMNDQVDAFAAAVRADPLLADGFDVVGFSQGALVARGYLERYNSPRAHNYVSLGGPHQGVYGAPGLNDWCPDPRCPWVAALIEQVAVQGPFEPLFQSLVSFAQYWKDPMNLTAYYHTSGFLADANNEKPGAANPAYKRNFLNTTGNYTFVGASQDGTIVPKESAVWGFFRPGNDTDLLPAQATRAWTEDLLGLRTAAEAGRVVLAMANCTHGGLVTAACKAEVYAHYVRPNVGGYLPLR